MKNIIILTLLFFSIFTPNPAQARVKMDLKVIKQIESSGNPKAYNLKSKARGLYQITPICLKEWNNYHRHEQYTLDNLWDTYTNTKIARWYLNERIPQMLKYYRFPDTWQNRIISYNAGISYVIKRKRLPSETKQYLKKYERLAGVK